MTGGVLSFGQFGGLILPLIYSLCLSITGSYQLGFFVCAAPALAVGVLLLQSAHKYKSLTIFHPLINFIHSIIKFETSSNLNSSFFESDGKTVNVFQLCKRNSCRHRIEFNPLNQCLLELVI